MSSDRYLPISYYELRPRVHSFSPTIRLGSTWVAAALAVSLFVLVPLIGGASASASSGGNSCQGEGTAMAGAPMPIFDCRVYELVSPVYTDGYPLNIAGISKDGSRLFASSIGAFSAPEGASALSQQYELMRRPAEWEVAALTVPATRYPFYTVENVNSTVTSGLWIAFEGAAGTFTRSSVQGVYLGPPSGPLTYVGPWEPPGGRVQAPNFSGASDDLSHILFFIKSPNSNEPSSLWPGDTTGGGRLDSLYEYAGKGNTEPRLVGISNVGVPESVGAGHLISSCGTYLGSFNETDAYNAISASGSIVFFTAAADTCGVPPPPLVKPLVNEVYARIAGEKTIAISEPSEADCATCLMSSKKNAVFAGASEDGTRVFFTTEQELLPGAEGENLYEYNFNAPAGERVTRVSVPLAGKAGVQGVARVSEDGSHVYFVAEGILSGANREGRAPSSVTGAHNLYVFSSECVGGGPVCEDPVRHTSFVATLLGSDSADWEASDNRPVQATPDGRFLVSRVLQIWCLMRKGFRRLDRCLSMTRGRKCSFVYREAKKAMMRTVTQASIPPQSRFRIMKEWIIQSNDLVT